MLFSEIDWKCDPNFLRSFQIDFNLVAQLLQNPGVQESEDIEDIDPDVIYCLACFLSQDDVNFDLACPVAEYLLFRVNDCKFETKISISYYLSSLIQFFDLPTSMLIQALDFIYTIYSTDENNKQLLHYLCDSLIGFFNRNFHQKSQISQELVQKLSCLVHLILESQKYRSNERLDKLKNLYLD